MTDTEPPIRLLLAAAFVFARIVAWKPGQFYGNDLVTAAVADADELLRQVPP